ncbi:hypothetical protein SLEP1_g52802 [Rubroshorea leprosula]|uniref:Uncharacterized protein n=1 Tax=Rubroshorea leprosula TaxID=152421 RepID=A0AAV5M7J5_9ROSI|nr:hypothetical protein SLEP1_g52802 [Rubroshorea leprosula]
MPRNSNPHSSRRTEEKSRTDPGFSGLRGKILSLKSCDLTRKEENSSRSHRVSQGGRKSVAWGGLVGCKGEERRADVRIRKKKKKEQLSHPYPNFLSF